MNDTKVDVKELLMKADGLLKGHFCLTSGLKLLKL